jgi:cytidine deaminase
MSDLGSEPLSQELCASGVSADVINPVAPPPGMPAEDVHLLRIAEELLGRVWLAGRHEVATALRTADGGVYTGVHIEGSCRRSSICAEGVALGTARAGLGTGTPLLVDAVVSVQIKPAGQYRIIAPCGVCRELISDYSPDATIWITGEAGISAMPALDLLPEKTRRAW